MYVWTIWKTEATTGTRDRFNSLVETRDGENWGYTVTLVDLRKTKNKALVRQ